MRFACLSRQPQFDSRLVSETLFPFSQTGKLLRYGVDSGDADGFALSRRTLLFHNIATRCADRDWRDPARAARIPSPRNERIAPHAAR